MRPRLRQARVLVVEDSPKIQKFLRGVLTAGGIGQLAFAGNGHEGLAALDEFAPDLVLLDLMMPEMDGFEFLSVLRTEPRWAGLPVIVQSALDSPEDRRRVFAAGASDYVAKPLDMDELLARVAIHLENALLIRELAAYQQAMEHELQLARDMQRGLLPEPELADRLGLRAGVRLSSHFEPSQAIGGDLWGALPVGERRLAVWMADFSGHGVAAAINAFRLHTLLSGLPADPASPAAVLRSLNDQLCGLLARGQYATMLYALVDSDEGVLVYASAGSPSPLLVPADGGAPQPLEASGLPLGIATATAYDTHRVTLPSGSGLLLYSDALTEAEGPGAPMLGEEGLAALLAEAASAGDPLRALLDRVFARTPRPLADDLTALWLRRVG